MKKNLLLILLITCWFTAQGQKEFNRWVFGTGAGASFNSGQFVFTPGNAMDAPEGCASIADASGNLQFYTHGETVWTKNHNVMQNGQAIQGNRNAAQSSVIIPKPSTPGRYYLFTVDPTIRALITGLKYSEIDMGAQNGLGSVIQKDRSLYQNTTEHLTAVRHQFGQDVWVLVVDQYYMNFRAYLVTSAGISTTPVISPVGFTVNSPKPVKGCMKFSPDGTKLAVNIGTQGTLVYRFNAATGQLSNPYLINSPLNKATYGVEFSGSSRYLYVSDQSSVRMYNLSFTTPAAVNASVYMVVNNVMANSLQLAPDGKIYVGLVSKMLGYIDNPDAGMYMVNYKLLTLATGTGGKGLPQYLNPAPEPLAIRHTNGCSSDSIAFSFNNSLNADSVVWVFGDPASGQANTSRSFTPKHLYSSTGTFTVTVTIYDKGATQVLTKDVTVSLFPRIEIVPRDTLYCEDTRVRLYNLYPPNTGSDAYQWYFNSIPLLNKTISHIAGTTGWYKLRVSSGDCSVIDSVYLRFQKKPEVKFKPLTRVCNDEMEPELLRATFEGATYKWQDGSTDSVFLATKPGKYSVVVTIGPCVTKAETEVIFSKPVKFSLGPDAIDVCERSYTLTSPYNNTTWSTGEKGKQIVVTESGTYTGTINGVSCPVSDSIRINFLWCITKADIPNIITPNGDDQNQKFFIKYLEPNVWSLDIYNRWGKQVYRKETYDNSWAAEGLNDGVYYYLMQNRRSGQVVKGWVEVVR